jgi:4-hydroxy-tetrahydrodipicolinate synthase
MQYTRSEAKAWSTEHIKDFYMCPLTPLNEDFTLDEI